MKKNTPATARKTTTVRRATNENEDTSFTYTAHPTKYRERFLQSLAKVDAYSKAAATCGDKAKDTIRARQDVINDLCSLIYAIDWARSSRDMLKVLFG